MTAMETDQAEPAQAQVAAVANLRATAQTRDNMDRPNILNSKPLDYQKFDDIDFSSDEDDCHPNIEINTWRRLKARMRAEKGIVKREPHLVDKWNTVVKNEKYVIDPNKAPLDQQQQQAQEQEADADADADADPIEVDSVEPDANDNENSNSEHINADANANENENHSNNNDNSSNSNTNPTPNNPSSSSSSSASTAMKEERKEDNSSANTSTATDATANAANNTISNHTTAKTATTTDTTTETAPTNKKSIPKPKPNSNSDTNNTNKKNKPKATKPKTTKTANTGKAKKKGGSTANANVNVNANKNRYQSAVETSTDDTFSARTNPQTFLEQNLSLLEKFSKTKNNKKAKKFLIKNFDLVHEASEGYLITYAVDRAVEGAPKKELQRLAKRCLMVHNLVQSCTQANVSPEKGVHMFYLKMANPKIAEQYKHELNAQCQELMAKIEVRRVERLREAAENAAELNGDGLALVDADDEELAPRGPGGLDPTEVLNSLPETMQNAFISQNVGELKRVLGEMDPAEANFLMQRCIDSGLWVQPTEEDEEPEPEPEPESEQLQAPAVPEQEG